MILYKLTEIRVNACLTAYLLVDQENYSTPYFNTDEKPLFLLNNIN